MHDARLLSEFPHTQPSLVRNGFTLVKMPAASLDIDVGRLESEQIVARYYPHAAAAVVEALERDKDSGVALKIRQAVVFDHTIRSRARLLRSRRFEGLRFVHDRSHHCTSHALVEVLDGYMQSSR